MVPGFSLLRVYSYAWYDGCELHFFKYFFESWINFINNLTKYAYGLQVILTSFLTKSLKTSLHCIKAEVIEEAIHRVVSQFTQMLGIIIDDNVDSISFKFAVPDFVYLGIGLTLFALSFNSHIKEHLKNNLILSLNKLLLYIWCQTISKLNLFLWGCVIFGYCLEIVIDFFTWVFRKYRSTSCILFTFLHICFK